MGFACFDKGGLVPKLSYQPHLNEVLNLHSASSVANEIKKEHKPQAHWQRRAQIQGLSQPDGDDVAPTKRTTATSPPLDAPHVAKKVRIEVCINSVAIPNRIEPEAIK